MVDDRLKFRCYRCNQLLSASPRRAGKEISCPRCKAMLVVPDPSVAQASARAPAGSAPRKIAGQAIKGPTAFLENLDDIASAIPEDLVGLRPEDIRVEAEFVDLAVDTSEPESPRPIAPARPVANLTAEAAPAKVSVETIAPPEVVEQSSTDADMDEILPPIAVETVTIRPTNRDIRHVREVVLQPATVLAWSLLVLLSIPMAFIAGLLIGHFLWK